jgi:ketosteroid isomerase-like protein
MTGSASDKEAIRELVSTYAAAAGSMDLQGLRATFTDDAVVYGMAEFVTPGAGHLQGSDAIVKFIGMALERSDYLTQIAQPANIVVDGDSATGICDIVEYIKRKEGPGFMLVVGRYDDKYRRTTAGWRFAKRKLEFRIYQRVAEIPM